MTNEQPKTHPMLATELLGYQPQLLLDELMSSVNETIYECVARVEDFLNDWIEEKRKAGEDVEPLTKELDHGMHALQTLLENYADLAFDFFEAWSHRNIFVVDPDLSIVAPHQRGLDLEVPQERERELQDDIKKLRRKLDNMRRQYARIRRSEAQAAQQRRKAEALLDSVKFLEVTATNTEKASLPLAAFLEALRKLYDIPIPDPGANSSTRPTHSKEAFISWAVDKLMKENGIDKIAANDAEQETKAIFDSDDDLRSALEGDRLPPDIDEEDEEGSLSDSTTDPEEAKDR